MSEKENPLQTLYFNKASQALKDLAVGTKEVILERGDAISLGEPWFEKLKAEILAEKSALKSSF